MFLMIGHLLSLVRVPLTLLRLVTRISMRSPFTMRSILLIIFCGYLVLGPISLDSDIIAAALAYGLLSLLGIIVIATTLLAILIKKSLLATLYLPEEPMVSGEASRFVLKISKVTLLPGAVLECRPVCVQSGLELPTVKLYRSTSQDSRVPIDVIAPHRGNWAMTGVQCTVADFSGFLRISWTIPLDTSLTVHPPEHPDALLPLISSTQRAGDLVTDTTHRHGDPFDTKPYHPADGVKKIIWKVFAKSGELLSRHPEPSMTPEGFVAMFVLARPDDDEVCGKALAYVRAIQELKLDLRLNCEGHNKRSLGLDLRSCQELLVDATWDSLASTADSIAQDLQALYDTCTAASANAHLHRMVIFCSGSRLASPEGETVIQELSLWMEQRNIEPVFFITQPHVQNIHKETWWIRMGVHLMTETRDSSPYTASPEGYQRFISSCLSKKWEVFV